MVQYGNSLGPGFRLEVQGQALSFGVTEFVDRLEYESSEDIVDMLRVHVSNPDFRLSKLKAFLPGNELSFWIGYGQEFVHIGRAVIVNYRCTFPPDGMPGIEVTAYTRDHSMMEAQPNSDPVEKAKSKSGKAKREIVAWKTDHIEEVVKQIAERWGFAPDIDSSALAPKPILQPISMSDYEFLKGLSNLAGTFFWVDGDEAGKWTLHFKNPGNIDQDAKYKFRYNDGDNTTLLSFQPELVFKTHYTQISAQFTLPSGKIVKVAAVEDQELEADPLAAKETDEWDLELPSAEAVQLFIGDYSFRAYPKVAIKDEATLEWWVNNWFKRHRQDFLLGEGEVVGMPQLRARQIHNLSGLAPQFDGDWEFTKVRHTLDPGSGYSCQFNCRRIG